VAPAGRVAALRRLLAGGAAMIAVGGAWPLLMWLTPAADRPWVAGTSDNSIWSLIMGYNGLGRLFGQSGGPGGAGGPGGGGAGGPGPGAFFGGQAGPLRLLNEALGGQAGWLLGFALVAGVGLVVATRLRRADARTGFAIAVGGAFLTTAVAFSKAAGIFHPYYVSALAPFTAMLVGGGVALMARRDLLGRVLAPTAIAAGVLCEIKVLHDNTGELQWVVPLLAGLAFLAAFALAGRIAPRVRAGVVAAVLGLLLLAPGVWAFQTLGHATSSTFPAGGPATAGMGFGGPGGPGTGGFRGMRLGGGAGGGFPGPAGGAGGGSFAGGPAGGGIFGGSSQELQAALAYAQAHGGGAVAVSSQTGASSAIIASGANVAGVGGFSGRESSVSVSWLEQAIHDGRIRWAIASGGDGFGLRGDTRTGSQTAMSWVQQNCKAVSSVSGLYDCKGAS
jgi:hypothetical protein